MRAHRFRCYHWPCGCPVDSFEDFDSHWSRRKRFGRPKLKIAGVTDSQNPILAKSASDWDFGQIFPYFLEILNFAPLVVAGTSWAPPLDSKWLPGVFAKYFELLRTRSLGAALENQNYLKKSAEHTSLKVSSAKGKGRTDFAKSSFRDLYCGWRFGDPANAFQSICVCI